MKNIVLALIVFTVARSSAKSALPEVVTCDATHACPDGNTCCQLAGGDWGCCPLAQAVCCNDHIHCCPNGFTCDTSSGRCNQGVESLPWLEKRPAIVSAHMQPPAKSALPEVVTCDATHACPDGNTCCQLAGGDWGCCPLAQAVCCNDHIHCCPNGYTCDTSTGRCNQGVESLPWLEKRPAIVSVHLRLPAKSALPEVVTCDATHACPDGNTCCQLAGGDWGCCPLAQAVCCNDHLHCCPNGYTCDTSTGRCNQGVESLPWLEKQPAIVSSPLQNRPTVVRCDATHECPNDNTCCIMAGNQWGCCPLPQAVCCADHVHCCPNGFKCDASSGQCQNGIESMPWLAKQPAVVR